MVMQSTWIVLSFYVLFMGLYPFGGKNTDVYVFLLYAMLLLTFPIGYLSWFIFLHISDLVNLLWDGVTFTGPYFLIVWLVFFLPGFWQWFILVPYVSRKIKKLVE